MLAVVWLALSPQIRARLCLFFCFYIFIYFLLNIERSVSQIVNFTQLSEFKYQQIRNKASVEEDESTNKLNILNCLSNQIKSKQNKTKYTLLTFQFNSTHSIMGVGNSKKRGEIHFEERNDQIAETQARIGR